MKKIILLSATFITLILVGEGLGMSANAQGVGINNNASSANLSAMMDITAGTGANRGLLIPRVTQAQRTGANFNPLPAAAQGLIVYQTDGTQGFYYNTSTTTTPSWTQLGATGWQLSGNGSTTAGTNYCGTSDGVDFVLGTVGVERMRILGTSNVGYVGIGTSTPSSKLEVAMADAAVRVRNTNDAGGAFIGNTFNSHQLGLYNPSGAGWGVIGAGVSRSILGFDNNGKVGSLTNNFPASPAFRNVLDDGSGNAGIGTATPGYKLEVSGGGIGGTYGLLPNYAGWAAYGTGDGGAAVYNDNGTYKTLMLVGNNSAGGGRQVSVWDYLTVNGNQTITGLAGTGDRLVMAHSTGQLFIGSVNQGYGSNVQWVDGASDISLSTTGTWTDMTNMTITFTPVHSTVLAEFSCSGDVSGSFPVQEDVLVRFVVDGATTYSGGAVICQDVDNNYGYVSGWNIHCIRPIALSVGVSHTIKIQWYLQATPYAKTVNIRPTSGPDWSHRTLFIND